jgi:hypothetical protein
MFGPHVKYGKEIDSVFMVVRSWGLHNLNPPLAMKDGVTGICYKLEGHEQKTERLRLKNA